MAKQKQRAEKKPTPVEEQAPVVPAPSRVNEYSEILLVNKLITDFNSAFADVDLTQTDRIHYAGLRQIL